MENYEDISTIPMLISEAKELLETGKYLSALYITLTLPDSLGKLVYPNASSNKERYIKWFDGNVRNVFGLLYTDKFYEKSISFNGEICYQLRCNLLHESSNDIYEKTEIDEFVLGFNEQRFFTGQTSGNEYYFEKKESGETIVYEKNYLYVGVTEICTDILEAVERFVAENPSLDYPTIRVNGGGGKISKLLLKRTTRD